MILLLSNDEDVTTDFVVRALRALDAPFIRLNANRLGQSDHVSIHCGVSARVVLRQGQQSSRLDECRVVYYRRPVPPALSAIEDAGVRGFAQREYRELVHNLGQVLRARWVNHPRAIRDADAKAFQLCLAAQLGFSTPETVVGNDALPARKLIAASSTGAIAKVLYGGELNSNGLAYHAYAEPISGQDVSDAALDAAPAIVQKRILKRADLRVTVVGDRVFSALIQGAPDADVDWRKSPTVRYSIWDATSEFEASCIALTRRLGLTYAALDFALDEADQPWFLEVNPAGQWAWIELETGLPISRAIASCLSEAAQQGVAADVASRRR